MADQNTQELSMEEILSSIRNMLNDEGVPSVKTSEDTEPVDVDQSETPFIAVNNPAPVQPISDPTEEDIAKICNNIRRLMDQPESTIAVPVVEPKANIAPVIPLKVINSVTNDNDVVSSNILDDFAAIFAKRRQQYPQTDASVRNVAEAAVLNEVVPVLQQWLQEKLPQAVQKEIERVMVKADVR